MRKFDRDKCGLLRNSTERNEGVYEKVKGYGMVKMLEMLTIWNIRNVTNNAKSPKKLDWHRRSGMKNINKETRDKSSIIQISVKSSIEGLEN